MTTGHSIPPLRELPAGRLDARKQHLLAEIGREQGHATEWSRLRLPGAKSKPSPSRRLILVLAVVAILGVLVVTPAFGVRGVLLNLLGRSDVPFAGAPPAASVVRREFFEMSSGAPKGMDPRVTPDEARLAGTLDFGGVKRHVWVAPTENGGFCYLLEGISGGCSEMKTEAVILDGSFFARNDATTPALESLAGRIYTAQATLLRVTFEDGKAKVLPFIYVSEPIGAGFFGYKPTRAEEQPGHRPLDVVVVDSAGSEIGSQTIDWAHEDWKLQQLRDTLAKRPTLGRPTATTTEQP